MNSSIEKALADLSPKLREVLAPIVTSESFDATISAEQFKQLLDASDMTDADLRVALLPFAAAYSHAPISNFYVGAIVRGLSGRLYFGANMEYDGVQLGQTVHAEQCAISHAWMKGEEGISDITINYSPCGHCRQFMNELSTADNLMVQLPQREAMTLQQYLPESFGPADLGVESALMASTDHGFALDTDEPLLTDTLAAMNKSHAPYTSNFSGVGLLTKSGKVYLGAYAENAAFNPSLPPLQVALNQLILAGDEFSSITEAALIEKDGGSISHLADTQSTLEALNPDIPLSYTTI